MAAEARPRTTGKDVISTVLAFVATIDQASPEEALEVLAFLRGFVAATGTPEEKTRALVELAPRSPTPS